MRKSLRMLACVKTAGAFFFRTLSRVRRYRKRFEICQGLPRLRLRDGFGHFQYIGVFGRRKRRSSPSPYGRRTKKNKRSLCRIRAQTRTRIGQRAAVLGLRRNACGFFRSYRGGRKAHAVRDEYRFRHPSRLPFFQYVNVP